MGHVRGVLPVARALVDDGWSATFALSPNHLRYAEDNRLNTPAPLTLVAKEPAAYGTHTTTDMAVQSFTESERLLAEIQPDVVVRDIADRGMLWAAEKRGLPCVTIATSGDNVLRRHGVAESNRWSDTRRQLGVPKDTGHASFSDLCVSLVPARFYDAESQITDRARFFRDTLTPRKHDDETLHVVVTLGTTAHAPHQQISDLVSSATAGTEFTVTFSVPDDLVDSVRASTNSDVRGFADITSLFDDAAVVVSHGGFNTVREVTQRGVPLLLFPGFADQPYVAHRCVALGLATLGDLNAGPAALLTDLRNSLSSRRRRVCLDFASEFARLPPLSECASEILALA